MKKIISIILALVVALTFCSCGKKKSDVEIYAERHYLMDSSIVREIESEYVDYDTGTTVFVKQILQVANNRIRLHWDNYDKVVSRFDYIVLTNGGIDNSASDFAPYYYKAYGYIVGKDLYGEEIRFKCNITISKYKSGIIDFDGIHIDGLDDNV